jgi:hypothetical protein
MNAKETVFDRSYKDYLGQIGRVSFEPIALKLGVKLNGNAITIPLFKSDYQISAEKISDPTGGKPGYDTNVILSKYLLLFPDEIPAENDWVTYRNFRDSGPLIHFFTNEIERSIADYFSRNLDGLKKASRLLGGYSPDLNVSYDFAVQFDALPTISVILLYNDADEEFPATCSILFERSAEQYLDAECIAMLGRKLFSRLKQAVDATE